MITALGFTERLSLGVFHAWEPARIIVTLTAYIDESGTHEGSPITVMAGIVSDAGRWREFDLRWNALLALPSPGRPPLDYVHGVELRQGKKLFKDWGLDERRAFAEKATKLIHEASFFSLTVLLKNKDYADAYLGSHRDKNSRVDSKYGVCFRVFLSTLAHAMAERTDADLHIVLEAGHANSGSAERIFAEMAKLSPELASRISGITYATKRQSPGVQAADMLAYPVFVLERDGAPKTSGEITPLEIPEEAGEFVANYHLEIEPEVLTNLRRGQMQMVEWRKSFGPHWQLLDGFPIGWSLYRLRSSSVPVLMPPRRATIPAIVGSPDFEPPLRLGCHA